MNKIANKDKQLTALGNEERENILNDISFKYAYEILKRLADEDINISKKIQKIALEYLVEVDPEDIEESVFDDLESLEVENVWDNSGGTRHGYVDPYDLASEMFEEAIGRRMIQIPISYRFLKSGKKEIRIQNI